MPEEKATKKEKIKNTMRMNSSGGGIYGFGIIGAGIYYLQHATTFWLGVIGLVKAIFWPAVLIYYIFSSLHL